MVTRGLERNVARDRRNMENPKKGKCHIPRKEHRESKEGQVPHTQREKGERKRGEKDTPNGETEMECSGQAGPTDSWDREV